MRHAPSIGPLALLCAAALVGCDDPAETPAPAGPGLGQVHAEVFAVSCAFEACHGGANPKADLDLSTADAAYAHLVDVAASMAPGVRVVPGEPDDSLLVRVLGEAVGDVRQMPPGFSLSAGQVQRVRDWIAAGAARGGDFDPAAVTGPDGGASVTGSRSPDELPPPPLEEGFQMGIDTVAPAGGEIWKCAVADLPTPGGAFTPVNRVHALQSPGVHHMDVMALGLLQGVVIEPGMYDCDALYETYPEMMEEGIFIFATQNEEEVLELPEGVAANLPGGLRVMVEIHYVNPTPAEVPVWSRINAYTIAAEDVVDSIWGSAVRDVDIDLAPGIDEWVEWTRCVLNRDVEMILLSSHTHELAERIEIFRFDGERTGELLYVNTDWHAPELMRIEPPMPIATGTGFEFRCHYRNPTDRTVNWGFTAEDEMCQMAFVHTPFNLAAACEVVESGAGVGALPPNP